VIKLADFGLAVHVDDPRARQWAAGTAGYMAPEVERNRYWMNLERGRGREMGMGVQRGT